MILSRYCRPTTPLTLLLALFIWGCGNDTAKKGSRIPAYDVHSGTPKPQDEALTGSYSLAFKDPLAQTSLALQLQFQLEDGGTLVVNTFAKNEAKKGSEQKLRGGLNLSFTRRGKTLRGKFVSCCGDEMADMPPLPDFDNQDPVSMYILIENGKPQVQIYKSKGDEQPVFDTESPDVVLNGDLYPGQGTYWGVSVTRGALYEAQLD